VALAKHSRSVSAEPGVLDGPGGNGEASEERPLGRESFSVEC
jgi:hypothetical protein